MKQPPYNKYVSNVWNINLSVHNPLNLLEINLSNLLKSENRELNRAADLSKVEMMTAKMPERLNVSPLETPSPSKKSLENGKKMTTYDKRPYDLLESW